MAPDTGWGGGPSVFCASGDADRWARLATGDRARKGVGTDARLTRKPRKTGVSCRIGVTVAL